MNRRTKFMIGISLIVSAITTTFAFLSLCLKKKSAWKAILALATVESLVGFALIEDKIPQVKIGKARKLTEPEEIFDESELDDVISAIDADLSVSSDDESIDAPHIHNDIPRDDEASEADFI